jgi:DNA-directed RNA polymerase subunit RPC12/RpoP
LPQTSCAPAVEIYALADSSDGSAPASQEEYIAVNCPVCHTRLMGMRWQIGRKIVCPDCGTRVRVPEPLVKLRPQWDRSPGRDYLVSPPIELPHHEVLLPGAADEARAREESLEGLSSPPPESEAAAEPPLPAPRLRTFFAGVFTFPLYREALPWWAMLSAGGLLIQAVLHQAVRYAGQPSFFTYIGAMLMGGMGAVLCLVLLVPATAIWLAVLQRTSDGYDHFDDWLDSVWLDWLLDGLFILNSAALSVLPGAAVARLAGFAPEATLLAEAAVAMVLFPVVLLSMMHQASAWRPWSPAIARSLWRARWGWLCFYLATIVLAALAAGMLWLVLQGGIWTAALAVPGLAAMSLIYFRLLGRLAWYGAGHGL